MVKCNSTSWYTSLHYTDPLHKCTYIRAYLYIRFYFACWMPYIRKNMIFMLFGLAFFIEHDSSYGNVLLNLFMSHHYYFSQTISFYIPTVMLMVPVLVHLCQFYFLYSYHNRCLVIYCGIHFHFTSRVDDTRNIFIWLLQFVYFLGRNICVNRQPGFALTAAAIWWVNQHGRSISKFFSLFSYSFIALFSIFFPLHFK